MGDILNSSENKENEYSQTVADSDGEDYYEDDLGSEEVQVRCIT